MREQRGDEIAGGTVAVRLADPHARRGERLEFFHRQTDGLGMSFQNPFVPADQRRHRNRFGRREGEVIKNPAVGGIVAGFVRPRGVQPLRQGLAGKRMPIFTKAGKCFRPDPAVQAEPFRAQTEPLAGHPLTFIVIIADAKMLLKVFLGVFQIVLGLGCHH